MATIYRINATYPGIKQIRRCRYTCTLGVLPGTAYLEAVPRKGDRIEPRGDLVLYFGNRRIRIRDCAVDQSSIEYTSEGQTIALRLFDRRWAWKFSDSSFASDPYTTTAKREAQLLLSRMEGGARIGEIDMPDAEIYAGYPVCYNQAAALAELCRRFGRDVAYDPISDKVSIVALGKGEELPLQESQALSFSIDTGPKPKAIAVIGGKSMFQTKLKLAAVGLDTDGYIRRIEDLSYADQIGSEPSTLFENIEDENARQLAKQTVYKWFYPVKQAGSDKNLLPVSESAPFAPGAIDPLALTKINDYLIYSPSISQASVTAGELIDTSPILHGVHYKESDPQEIDNPNTTDLCTPYDGTFRIDEKNKLVITNRPVFSIGSDGQVVAPELYLETSYPYGNNFTWGTAVPGDGKGTVCIYRPDLKIHYAARYSTEQGKCIEYTELLHNAEETIDKAEGLAKEIAKSFETSQMSQARYRGLIPIRPDGAIRQVSWEVDLNRGAHTWATRNTEALVGSLRAPERRDRVASRSTGDIMVDLASIREKTDQRKETLTIRRV